MVHRDQQSMLLFTKAYQATANQWPRFQIKLCSHFCPDQPIQFSLSIRRPDQVVFHQMELALVRCRDAAAQARLRWP